MSTILYIICYFVYTALTSTILSLLLGFRLLRRLLSTSTTPANDTGNVIALYQGSVHHQRRHPARNSFRFTARYALIDLDCPPYAPPAFLSAGDARRAAKTNGPVFLLTTPPSVGYHCSPVNIYYCYDIEGSKRIFKKCIVQGFNTPWDESVSFVFNPSSDSVPKCEYISPFSDMRGVWRLKCSEPGEDLYAFMSVDQHPELGNNFFIAKLKAKRVVLSTTSSPEAFFWLQSHKITAITYWNGLKLWWKNVPFYEHPRKENPDYRKEAMSKNQFCPAFGPNEQGTNIDRCFVWKDAPWPWSNLIAPRCKNLS